MLNVLYGGLNFFIRFFFFKFSDIKSLFWIYCSEMTRSVWYDSYHLPYNTASNPFHTKTVISFHRKRLLQVLAFMVGYII
jgi:hypothetical protein